MNHASEREAEKEGAGESPILAGVARRGGRGAPSAIGSAPAATRGRSLSSLSFSLPLSSFFLSAAAAATAPAAGAQERFGGSRNGKQQDRPVYARQLGDLMKCGYLHEIEKGGTWDRYCSAA